MGKSRREGDLELTGGVICPVRLFALDREDESVIMDGCVTEVDKGVD